MKTSVHKKSFKCLLSSAAGIPSSFRRFSIGLLGMILVLTAKAQTYTTQADGNWINPATWLGGVVPSTTIGAGKIVNINHNVTFNQNSDLIISGTLNIADTLTFGSSFNKNVLVNSGGLLSVNNGAFIQDISTNQNSVTVSGGRVSFINAYIVIGKDFSGCNGSSRAYKNSKIYIGSNYTVSGISSSPSTDTIQNSLVQSAMGSSGNGNFTVDNYATLRVANAAIKTINNGSFIAMSGASISVLKGANSNYGFDLLKIAKDLQNDGTWKARIDAACIGGTIKGSQMADIDFTRSQDCASTPNIGDAPELIFKNPVLKSGQANKQGAVYRFADVISGVDAEIKLKKFSRSDIVMQNIDLASLGWDKAFQPQFGLAGLVQPLQNWYIDFELKFYYAGTNTIATLTKVDMTALDVDGDGRSINEYAVFQNPSNVMYSTVNYLTEQPAGSLGQSFTCPVDGLVSPLISCLGCGGDGKTGIWNLTDCGLCNATGLLHSLCNHPFDETNGNTVSGPVENFTNIDTAATQVMTTYQYSDVNTINFRYGARSGVLSSNGAGVRLNSLWFRQFSLAPPSILPVKLHSFAATLNKKDVNLMWTAEEENVSHYVLQRSTDGKNFSDIAIVFANNSSSASTYQYKDASVASSTNTLFYRLQMIDIGKEGGNFSQTKVIKLGVEAAALKIMTYPNPVTDRVQITLPESWQGKPVMLQLYTNNGTMVQGIQLGSASQTETMQLGRVPKGVYLIKAVCNGETAQQQVVKN